MIEKKYKLVQKIY